MFSYKNQYVNNWITTLAFKIYTCRSLWKVDSKFYFPFLFFTCKFFVWVKTSFTRICTNRFNYLLNTIPHTQDPPHSSKRPKSIIFAFIHRKRTKKLKTCHHPSIKTKKSDEIEQQLQYNLSDFPFLISSICGLNSIFHKTN